MGTQKLKIHIQKHRSMVGGPTTKSLTIMIIIIHIQMKEVTKDQTKNHFNMKTREGKVFINLIEV
jgi:hypothetical protein